MNKYFQMIQSRAKSLPINTRLKVNRQKLSAFTVSSFGSFDINITSIQIDEIVDRANGPTVGMQLADFSVCTHSFAVFVCI